MRFKGSKFLRVRYYLFMAMRRSRFSRKVFRVLLALIVTMTLIMVYLAIEAGSNRAVPFEEEKRTSGSCGYDVDLLREGAEEVQDILSAITDGEERVEVLRLRLQRAAGLVDSRPPPVRESRREKKPKRWGAPVEALAPAACTGKNCSRPNHAAADDDHDREKKQKPSIHLAITVLLISLAPLRNMSAEGPLKPLRSIFPNMPIRIAMPEGSSFRGISKATEVLWVETAQMAPGALLNRLAAGAETPLLLVARDVTRVDALARVELLARKAMAFRTGSERRKRKPIVFDDGVKVDVRETMTGTGVVGGAVRDPLGRWSAGCAQTRLRHYALRMRPGYRYSALDCMLCDHLRGPFVVHTDLVSEVPFSESLQEDLVFVDWFLRLKEKRVLVAACPDSMFFVGRDAELFEGQGNLPNVDGSDRKKNVSDRAFWMMAAKEWNVHQVLLPGRSPLKFTCNEMSISCIVQKGLLLPQCCLDMILHTLKELDYFASDNNLDYELVGNTLLGAVKLRNLLPWEQKGQMTVKDGDDWILYDRKLPSLENYFEYFVKSKEIPICSVFHASFMIFDVFCAANLTTRMLPNEMQASPTRVNVHGHWMRAYWNPGLYLQLQYGFSYLKHRHGNACSIAQDDDVFISETKVVNPYGIKHGCLIRYPGDGSFDFFLEDSV